MKFIRLVWLPFLLYAAGVCCLHVAVVSAMEPGFSPWSIQTYQFCIGLLAVIALVAVSHFDATKVGFTFLGLSLIKIMAGTVFLYFTWKGDPPYFKPYVLHFVAAHFLYLGIEAFLAVRLTQLKS